jgi:predicted Zn-dependent peptidase
MAEMHSLTAVVTVGTGSRYEDFKVNGGVSHFLEHILFKGSKNYPSAQAVAEAVDSVGGSNNAYTTLDTTAFYIKLPSESGGLALDILSDMVKNPLINAAEVDRERGVVVEEMNLYRDDPAQFVHTLVPKLLFPNNPLGYDVLGSEEVINKIPTSEIRAYMEAHYTPGNIVVSVAGQVDHEEVVARIKQLMGGMKPAADTEFLPVSERPSSELTSSIIKPTAQAHFVIGSRGYSYNDKDSRVAKVTAAILGMGMSSRLFTNVRERQGLAYNIFADHVQFTDTGMFSVYAGASIDRADKAVSSVLDELRRISEEPVGEAELTKSKCQLAAALEMGMEANSAVADRISSQLLLLGRVKPLEETIEEINSVTSEDIMRVSAKMLSFENLRLAVIAPDPKPIADNFVKLVSK